MTKPPLTLEFDWRIYLRMSLSVRCMFVNHRRHKILDMSTITFLVLWLLVNWFRPVLKQTRNSTLSELQLNNRTCYCLWQVFNMAPPTIGLLEPSHSLARLTLSREEVYEQNISWVTSIQHQPEVDSYVTAWRMHVYNYIKTIDGTCFEIFQNL